MSKKLIKPEELAAFRAAMAEYEPHISDNGLKGGFDHYMDLDFKNDTGSNVSIKIYSYKGEREGILIENETDDIEYAKFLIKAYFTGIDSILTTPDVCPACGKH